MAGKSKVGIIQKYGQRGYVLTYEGDDYLQFTKPKRFSFGWALLWVLLIFAFGIGLLFLAIQIIMYLSKKDEVIIVNLKQKENTDETTVAQRQSR
ncbi:MAG: hypothetical protein OXR68_07390 [Alphaproteobacteria bacterium]|nr:hypothetical protein [Alphaproteobacteria bacterium]MDD9920426.1 hypothetical protein [Alphaproteobacteria bacterium]